MRRFPIGLTMAAVIAFALLTALGVWQLDRLKQTNANRAAVAALGHAPARPLERVLRDPTHADHARVEMTCEAMAPKPASTTYRYALPKGVVGWRLLSMCPIAAATFDGVLLDRGLVTTLAGAMAPAALVFPPPGSVTGVLRKLGRKPMFGDAMPSSGPIPIVRVIDPATLASVAARSGLKAPAPWYVVVERETPSAPGVAPAAVAEDVPRDNFGYALTWFGLALALLGVWGAFVWRRVTER